MFQFQFIYDDYKYFQSLFAITSLRNYPTKNKNFKKGKKFLSQKKRSNNRK